MTQEPNLLTELSPLPAPLPTSYPNLSEAQSHPMVWVSQARVGAFKPLGRWAVPGLSKPQDPSPCLGFLISKMELVVKF